MINQIGLHKYIEVKESTKAITPQLIGWIKPCVLLPTSTLVGLSPTQLETIIAHELIHIKRHDHWVNLFQIYMEIVFFYHPGVHWVSKQTRLEREYSCDEQVLSLCKHPPVTYAKALLTLQIQSNNELSLAANDGVLLKRIDRLAYGAKKKAHPFLLFACGILLCITFLTTLFISLKISAAQLPNSNDVLFNVAPVLPSKLNFKQHGDQSKSHSPQKLQGFHGKITRIANHKKSPAVVLVTQCHTKIQSINEWTKLVYDWGFVSLHFTPCSFIKDGKTKQLPWAHMPFAVYGALNYLREQDFVDANNIAIIDLSERGRAALSTINSDGAQSLFNYKFKVAAIFSPQCSYYTGPYISPALMLFDSKEEIDNQYCQETMAGSDKQPIFNHFQNDLITQMDETTIFTLENFLTSHLN